MVWTITFGVGRIGDPSIPIGNRVRAAQGALLAIELGTLVLAAVFAERRRYEAVVKQSEARLQEALTAGQVMAFEWDPRTRISQRSANAAQILGFEPHKGLPATCFLAQVHSDDRANLKASMLGLTPQSPSYAARFRFKRADDEEVWLEETATAEFDATGRLLQIKGLAKDITERKHAEETLQDNEQKFRELLGALPAAIYVTDAAGHVTYWNQGAADLWGVTPRLGVERWCDFARFFQYRRHSNATAGLPDGNRLARRSTGARLRSTDGAARWNAHLHHAQSNPTMRCDRCHCWGREHDP